VIGCRRTVHQRHLRWKNTQQKDTERICFDCLVWPATSAQPLYHKLWRWVAPWRGNQRGSIAPACNGESHPSPATLNDQWIMEPSSQGRPGKYDWLDNATRKINSYNQQSRIMGLNANNNVALLPYLGLFSRQDIDRFHSTLRLMIFSGKTTRLNALTDRFDWSLRLIALTDWFDWFEATSAQPLYHTLWRWASNPSMTFVVDITQQQKGSLEQLIGKFRRYRLTAFYYDQAASQLTMRWVTEWNIVLYSWVFSRLWDEIIFCIVTSNNKTLLDSIAFGLVNKAAWNRFGIQEAPMK
jgi:hypothetical protein